jgi:23S rRNA (cytosine1962-C5)-methyltransferase
MTTPRVILRPKRAKPFFARHPWVFAGAIDSIDGEPADGDVVDLISHAGNFVARGLYNSKSKIRVRLYAWSDTAIDSDFFRERLQAAIRLRGEILRLDGPGTACRVVFSEADGLSGMVVDRYDRWLALQFTSLGLAQRRDQIIALLNELTEPEGIYLRTERGIGQLEGLELADGLVSGREPDGPILIEEHGVRFHVNLALGQKTGFYLDQRDNRSAVAQYAAGRSMLDAFCYTGGFGLHAARSGAQKVIGIDVSEPALELARENAGLNGLNQLSFVRAQVFSHLERLIGESERFDLIVLDPPKFARAQGAVEEAMRGYRRLQTLALKLLEPDGILVTCCCSGLITMDMLEALLAQLAVQEGRDVQILERRGQASDHPVLVTCPESNYLKCLICRVSRAGAAAP